MGVETEVKIRIGSVEDFIEHAMSHDARRVSERCLEDNILFDYPDGRLGTERCALRVRSVAGRGVLTYKGASKPDVIFKSREELETGVENPETAIEIFGRIGLRQKFRYQKYRQEFVLDGVHVAVDETPVGNYTELEGTEDEILCLAAKLGIAKSQFIRKSYYALYIDSCNEQKLIPQAMVF